ncbi:MAG: hypothetical protein HOP10_03075 [Chitinophagaceae bacterium]|nr:hypothetical protein [Chitinophagaceae bacterium]
MGSQRGSGNLSDKDKKKLNKGLKSYKKKTTEEEKPKINIADAKRRKKE